MNLAPGYVNNEVLAEVGPIEQKTGKAPNNVRFWKFPLRDTTSGQEVGGSMFTAPRFKEGDVIKISGQGIKYEDGQYGKKLSWGEKAQVTVLGASAHHDAQTERRSESSPTVNGKQFPVAGQSVGHALTHAVNLLTEGFTREERIAWLLKPMSWASVHEVASDMIRVARLLEAGKLAPSVRERVGGASAARPEPAQRQDDTRNMTGQGLPGKQRLHAPTDEQLANRDDNAAEEDCPF